VSKSRQPPGGVYTGLTVIRRSSAGDNGTSRRVFRLDFRSQDPHDYDIMRPPRFWDGILQKDSATFLPSRLLYDDLGFDLTLRCDGIV
jgi:hypothetical protein